MTAKQLRKTKKSTIWLSKWSYSGLVIVDEVKTCHVFSPNLIPPAWWQYPLESEESGFRNSGYSLIINHYEFIGYL